MKRILYLCSINGLGHHLTPFLSDRVRTPKYSLILTRDAQKNITSLVILQIFEASNCSSSQKPMDCYIPTA